MRFACVTLFLVVAILAKGNTALKCYACADCAKVDSTTRVDDCVIPKPGTGGGNTGGGIGSNPGTGSNTGGGNDLFQVFDEIQSAVPQVFRARQSTEEEELQCKCFTFKKDGKYYRGYSAVKKGLDLCALVAKQIEDCKLCDTDKCNSSTALKFSVITLITVLVCSYLF